MSLSQLNTCPPGRTFTKTQSGGHTLTQALPHQPRMLAKQRKRHSIKIWPGVHWNNTSRCLILQLKTSTMSLWALIFSFPTGMCLHLKEVGHYLHSVWYSTGPDRPEKTHKESSGPISQQAITMGSQIPAAASRQMDTLYSISTYL